MLALATSVTGATASILLGTDEATYALARCDGDRCMLARHEAGALPLASAVLCPVLGGVGWIAAGFMRD